MSCTSKAGADTTDWKQDDWLIGHVIKIDIIIISIFFHVIKNSIIEFSMWNEDKKKRHGRGWYVIFVLLVFVSVTFVESLE